MDKTVIVGLGNPGKRYTLTRHNVGAMVVDALAQELHAPPFKLNKRLYALVTQSVINDQLSVIVAKPQTFMNLSGRSILPIVRAYCNTPLPYGQGIALPLLVTTDDLDLPFGTIRYRERGSAGGHNGLKSVIECLGSQDFPRIKIGIKPPGMSRQPGKAEEFVLERFTKDELAGLKNDIVPKAIKLILEKLGDRS